LDGLVFKIESEQIFGFPHTPIRTTRGRVLFWKASHCGLCVCLSVRPSVSQAACLLRHALHITVIPPRWSCYAICLAVCRSVSVQNYCENNQPISLKLAVMIGPGGGGLIRGFHGCATVVNFLRTAPKSLTPIASKRSGLTQCPLPPPLPAGTAWFIGGLELVWDTLKWT